MSNAVEAIEGRMSSLTAPLAGPKPAGEDLSFDPDFERVKAEIDKIGRVSSGAPDWALVATSSAQLLARTKDMRVATWFAAGRMNQGGWSGLAEGLVVLRAFVTKDWDILSSRASPPRSREHLRVAHGKCRRVTRCSRWSRPNARPSPHAKSCSRSSTAR